MSDFMTMNDLSAKTVKELNEMLSTFAQELMNLRFRKQMAELTDFSQFKKVRKKIAQVKLTLSQKQLQQ